jgi:2-(1,2-epoxy-1,2-dihydrophenyl)acetyl-CoA isomerase
MHNYKVIELETEGDVGILRLNQPAKLNAVNIQMAEELANGLDVLAKSVRAVILTGAGRAFCSGAALDEAVELGDPQNRDVGIFLEEYINPLLTQLRGLPIPWIAAVRGAAAGVGASLALSADLIVASDTAYFLQAFARIGLVPDGGATHFLVRTVGRVRAMELMMLAERLPAAKACEWGLINRVVADADLERESLQWAHALARGPSVALGLIRKAVWNAADDPWSTVLAQERNNQMVAGRTADCQEGVKAFHEKRPAQFVGR